MKRFSFTAVEKGDRFYIMVRDSRKGFIVSQRSVKDEGANRDKLLATLVKKYRFENVQFDF